MYYDAYLGKMMECNPLAVERNRVKSATSSAPVERFWRYNRAVMFTLKPAPTGVIGTTLFGIMAHCVSEFDIVHDTNIPGGLVGTPYGDAVANLPAKPVVVEFLGTIISGTLFKKQDLDANRLASADGIDKVTDPTVGTVKPNVTDEYQEFLDYLARPGMAGEAVGGNKSIVNWVSTPATGSPVYVYGREDGMSWTGGPGGDWGQPGRYTAFEQWNKGGATQLVVAQFTGYQSRYYPGAAVPSGTNNRNGLAGSRDGDYYAFSTTKIGGAGGAPLGTFRGKVTIENYGTIAGGGGGVYSLPANTSADGADAIHITDEVVWNFVNRGTILGRGGSGMVYRDSNLKPTFVIDELPQIGTNHAACGRLFVNVTVDAGAFLNLNYTTTSQVSDSYWATTLYKVMGSATLNVARYQDNEQTVENLAGEWPRQVQLAPVEGSALAIETLGIRSVFDVNEIAPETYAGKTTYVPDDFTGSLHDARPGSGMFGTKYVFFSRNKLPMSPEDIGQTSAYNSVVALTNFYSNAVKRIVDLDKVDVSAVYTVTNIILTLKAANKQQWILVWYGSQTLDVINGDVDINTLPITWTNNAARITFQAKQTSLLPHLDTLLGITFLTDDFEDADYFAKVKLDAIPTCASIHEGGPGYSNYGQITAQVTKQNINVRLVSVAHRDEKTLDVTLTATVIRSLNRKNAVAKAVDPAPLVSTAID
ncbi:hypothetical protein SPFM10_00127 [Salmonella phage SPFM10]|nr:hypothetical protein SPFM10_00127 [Salmonella phage SPFM10]